MSFRIIKGEGAVSMVIKPLDDALADNDHIYAVVCLFLSCHYISLTLPQILGSAINSSGSGAPLHAPNAAAQKQCVRDAFADAKRDPKEVDFVELHATGSFIRSTVTVLASTFN
jgi:acyl transferase domain-containing protein